MPSMQLCRLSHFKGAPYNVVFTKLHIFVVTFTWIPDFYGRFKVNFRIEILVEIVIRFLYSFDDLKFMAAKNLGLKNYF